MLRRLYPEQPESFAFTPKNMEWAEAQITKFPAGRAQSAVIPLLWRAQEQEGWLSKPAIEYVADMLGMARIRAFEVASFYFMFQLAPTGSIAHVQICGTTSCMICGAEDLIKVCQERINAKPYTLSADGKFTWEEVECLGACANAPMVQIGKDYYEDLTAERFAEILEELAAGKVPVPGPQNGRYSSEPLSGLTSLTEYDSGKTQYNASVQLATDIGDTVKRIDGTEVPILKPWMKDKDPVTVASPVWADDVIPDPSLATPAHAQASAAKKQAEETSDAPHAVPVSDEQSKAKPETKPAAEPADTLTAVAEEKPELLDAARDGGPDDLKKLKGVGPKLEAELNEMGFYHYDQIANWTTAEIAWVDSRLKFKGRIIRDGWVQQAKELAAGGETEFSKRVDKGDVY